MTTTPSALSGPVGRALVALATVDDESATTRGDLVDRAIRSRDGHALPHLVEEHRLEAPFLDALRATGRDVPSTLADRVAAQRATRMRITAALRPLAGHLDDADVEWVVVKGPIVARRMPRPGHRAFNDLDLVVASRDFGRALDVLVGNGALELNRNWEAYLRYGVGEVPLEFAGLALDVHWSFVGLESIRRTVHVPTDDMVRRRVDVVLDDGLVVPALEPTDRLLHLCLHAALSGATRLDQLRDITAEIGDGSAIDWALLDRRARAASVAPLIAHALDRAARVLDANAPAATVDRLGGASVRIRRLVDATGSPRRPVLRGVPVKIARNTFRDRWLARTRILPREAMRRLGSSRTWDFADPNSVIYSGTDTGGPAARQAFIDSVG